MRDILFGEVSAEVKNYMTATIFGDIHVEVNVEFKPSWMPHEDKDKIALDMVNNRLRMLSGEISHSVKEFLNEQLGKKEDKQ